MVIKHPRAKKAQVKYKEAHYIEAGRSAILKVLKHPILSVSDVYIKTSRVLAANAKSGRIETQNTVYTPVPELRKPFFVIG